MCTDLYTFYKKKSKCVQGGWSDRNNAQWRRRIIAVI